MKTCNKCGEEKDLSAFLPDSRYKGGYRHTCKICYNANSQRIYKANTEHIKARNAAYYQRNKNLWSDRDRWSVKNQAQYAVWKALQKGLIAPASACSCNDCEAPAKDLHHHSYEPEHWLDVVPLCRSCHQIRHKNPERF